MHDANETQASDVSTTLHNIIRAVLCDVGGVLIHTRRTPELLQWEKSHGFQPLGLPLAVWLCEAGQRAAIGEASVEEVWSEVQLLYALTDAELVAFKHDFAASDQLDPVFVQFLRDVSKTSKLALLSNTWPGERHTFGNVFGLATLTDTMILSYEVGLAKPDPRIYALAAARLQLPPSSIVFIDDYPPNVVAAQAYGMHGVVFESREQAIAELQTLLHG
jgi:HAD superfamily hydrolase (TIGR01509 family)